MTTYCERCEKDIVFCAEPKTKTELAAILAKHNEWHDSQDPAKIHARIVASSRAGS